MQGAKSDQNVCYTIMQVVQQVICTDDVVRLANIARSGCTAGRVIVYHKCVHIQGKTDTSNNSQFVFFTNIMSAHGQLLNCGSVKTNQFASHPEAKKLLQEDIDRFGPMAFRSLPAEEFFELLFRAEWSQVCHKESGAWRIVTDRCRCVCGVVSNRTAQYWAGGDVWVWHARSWCHGCRVVCHQLWVQMLCEKQAKAKN